MLLGEISVLVGRFRRPNDNVSTTPNAGPDAMPSKSGPVKLWEALEFNPSVYT